MNPWSHKLLQNTVKNITKKILLPAFVFLSLPASIVEAQARPAYGESTSHGAIAPSSRRDSEPKGSVLLAQITPDGTLKTQVEIIQQLMEINGGLREGNNLFHSFSDFNIPEGMEASFQNAIDIENIFTRVTGDSISNINGILSTQGAANFFLMNPNGVVFGENASINVGGSFMATTADSINFEDGTAFAASDTSADPILTTEQPNGFTFDGVPGAIEVYGRGTTVKADTSLSPTSVTNVNRQLNVNSDSTLALIGNGINIDGGTLTTNGGSLELGSVDNGTVGIQKTENEFAFDYSNINQRQDINLNNRSLLNASGNGNGAISLTGKNISLQDGSLTLIQNQNTSDSGDIIVNATDRLTLSGTSPDGNVSSDIRTETINNGGRSGNITVSTNELILKTGARISAATFNNADGGNISINAKSSVQLLENTGLNPERETFTASGIAGNTFAGGDAGNVQITTPLFRVTNGGAVVSTTSGAGTGGEVTVNSDLVEVSGTDPNRETQSTIAASTFDVNSAGSVNINTSQLKLKEGGTISSSSFNTGDAGNLNINASSSIDISGQTDGSSSQIRSAVIPTSQPVQDISGLTDAPSGSGGNVIINTPTLNVNESGIVSVSNEGLGNSGRITVNASDINLNNDGSIAATSTSGAGGNINLNADNLQIDNQSTITTEAENQGGGGNVNINASNITAKKNSAISANATGGDGGNVTINSDILLGIDNSDITANAIEGDGGNITINADFIIGFEERTQLTPFNDIVASSEFGQSGTININSPESTAEEDLTVNARQIESVEAGEFLKAVCPNPDNRYGKKTFQYYARGVPEGLGNYHDYDEEEILKDLPVHQKIERETYRHSTEPPSLPDANSIPDTYPDYPDETFEGRAEPVVKQFPYTTSPLQVIYSQTNQVPPTPRPRKPGEPALEANAVQINPDGSKHFIRVAQIEHPSEQMCVRPNQTYSSKE